MQVGQAKSIVSLVGGNVEEPRIEENRILFGADPTEGIVAAELAGRFIRLFFRDESGVRFKDDPFRPFILLTSPALLDGFGHAAVIEPLAGEAGFRYLAFFKEWRECLAARDFLARKSGVTPSDPAAPYLFLSDPVQQHFLLSGKTLFKGFVFDHLKRLALDIETACAEGFEFSNPQRPEDRIISIAVVTSAGREEVLAAPDLDEAEMLARLTEIIRQEDPDVIEGHNLFRFDLEYLRVRAERHGIPLRWGRDGSVPRVHHSRFTVAERAIDYPRWDIYGRHVIDTYFLLLVYDVSSRELESFGLKAAALHFGLAAPDRVYLDRQKIDRVLAEAPETLMRYNLDDARETLALARLLSYPYFLQTRMFPYSYQNCVVRGTATKINTLLLREYLRRREAIPEPGGDGSFAGGYNDVLITGVVGPVVHCDVASLYPSILLAFRLQPYRDRLGLFLPLLGELKEFRLAAKKRAREEHDPRRRDYWQAQQQAFKVLINSFYGYLGTTLHNFSDVALAAEVTAQGRQLIGTMLAWLETRQVRAVEVDTDGIYFIPPPGITTTAQAEQLVQELSQALPAGIDVEMDGYYRAMFSYKMKNYALLGYDGKVTVRGSALRSRGTEKYLRGFMEEMIRLLLTDEGEKIPELYRSYLQRLYDHGFDITWLARTETLGESPAVYRQKVRQGKRNPSAAFEVALKSGRELRAGDQVSYYVSGRGLRVTAYENCRAVAAFDPAHPDENVPYYADRLAQLLEKFARFIPGEKSLFD
jgi:DNA polymerase elongation subunit (family B)